MDKRIQRSRHLLKEAFCQIMKKQEPDEITVKQVCEKAGVNRSTFYAHFETMPDLTNSIITDHVADIMSIFAEVTKSDEPSLRQYACSYVDYFLSNADAMRLCTCKNREYFRALYVHIVLNEVMQLYEGSHYYIMYYITVGSLATLLRWVMDGMKEPKEEIIDVIHVFTQIAIDFAKDPDRFKALIR